MGSDVSARLIEAWTDEVQAAVVYGLIATREADPRRAEVLRQLAEIERAHRTRLEDRMRELGIEVPDERTVKISAWRRLQAAQVYGGIAPACTHRRKAEARR